MEILINYFISTVGLLSNFIYRPNGHQRRQNDDLACLSRTNRPSSRQVNKLKSLIHKGFCVISSFITSTGILKLQNPSKARIYKKSQPDSSKYYDTEQGLLPLVYSDAYTTAAFTRIVPEANIFRACRTKTTGPTVNDQFSSYIVKRKSATKQQSVKIIRSPFVSILPVPEPRLDSPQKNPINDQQVDSYQSAFPTPELRPASPTKDHNANAHQPSFSTTPVELRPEYKDPGSFKLLHSNTGISTVTPNIVAPLSSMQMAQNNGSQEVHERNNHQLVPMTFPFQVPRIDPSSVPNNTPIQSSMWSQSTRQYTGSFTPTHTSPCRETFTTCNQGSKPLLLTTAFFPDSRFFDSEEDLVSQTFNNLQEKHVKSSALFGTNPLPLRLTKLKTVQSDSSSVVKVKLCQAKTIKLCGGEIGRNPFWYEIYDKSVQSDLG